MLVIPTLFGAATLVFIMLRLIPGDICEIRMAGDGGYFDKAAVDTCRAEMGTNKPLLTQFFNFVWGLMRFDFGTSMWTGQPVLSEVALRFELSLQVAIMATIIGVIIAIPLGTIAAVRQNTCIKWFWSISRRACMAWWWWNRAAAIQRKRIGSTRSCRASSIPRSIRRSVKSMGSR